MKRNLFAITILILFFFISLILIGCGATTTNESNATETTVSGTAAPTTVSETTAAETTAAETAAETTAAETAAAETVFNLSILNGVGTNGIAAQTSELFKDLKYPDGQNKYSIGKVGDADNHNYKNTQIICKSQDSTIAQAAEEIKTILKVGIITTQNGTSQDYDIVIIIGKDYLTTTGQTTATAANISQAPTIKLSIYDGPTYSVTDQVCYYRVRAIVTGSSSPTISFSIW